MNFLQRLWSKREQKAANPLYLYNTMTQSKEEFTLPSWVSAVHMYNCGPTVYGPQHIGNLSMFVFTDILRRVLEYNNFTVKQVINFTDVGHLVSDADEGEDKMTKGLKREGLKPTLENMRNLGERYAKQFLEDARSLNIATEHITFPRASDYIPAQIAMIKTLEEKTYAYRTKRGVYFDTARFPDYGRLGGIDLSGLKEGARVATNLEKRNPIDFLLWKLDPKIGWDSPWGKGFPGWHIECSAMINATLGKQIDIHTGGIEHIPVHHNNEIAQSEAAIGKKPFSRFWLHRAHLQITGEKIAKSQGNTVYLADIVEKRFHPLSARYLFLGAHYRTPANFTWEALLAAQTCFLKLRRFVDSVDAVGTIALPYQRKMHERFNDDLDTPGALGILWEVFRDRTLSPADIKATIINADLVFGLGLATEDKKAADLCTKLFGTPVLLDDVPKRIRERIQKREEARKNKDWQVADTIRSEVEAMGYTLEDSPEGTRIFKFGK